MENVVGGLSWFFQWLLTSSLQISVLVCLIFVIKAVFRGRLVVRWHYWLWLFLLVRMVMPWVPSSRFSIFTVISKTQALFVTGQASEVAPGVGAVPPGSDRIPYSATKPVVLPSPHERDEWGRPIPEGGSISDGENLFSLEVTEMLSLVWFAVALSLFGFALVYNFRFWRVIVLKRPLTDETVLNLLEDCKTEMGIQTILGIIVTDRVKSPALFGVIRPRLLLPEAMFGSLDREQLRCVFLHELAHLKRRDVYLGWLMVILQALHWFNPLVWFAFHRMRADRELACDGLVLSTTGSAKAQIYGQTLIHLFRRFSGLQYVPGVAGILENKSQLERRITMIAQFKKGSYRWSFWAVVMLAGAGCLFFTNAQGVESQVETNEPEVMAQQFVGLLVQGKFSQAVDGFDATMKKALPVDKLAETWRTTTGQGGLFKQQLGTRLEKFLGSDIVFVTCEFEKGPMDVKIVYDSDRKISGLWFLPTPQKVLDEFKGKGKQKSRKTQKPVKLSYGGGKSAGRQSIAGSGHSIRFDAPGEGCVVTSVRIYGSRYGYDRPPKENFHIYLCDGDYNVIADFPFPYSRFRKGDKNGNPRGWVTFQVKPTPVPSSFFVSVDFNPERTKGVYVHYDAESTGHSFIAIPGQPLKAFDRGDWMIQTMVKTPAGTLPKTQPKVTKRDRLQAENLTKEGWQLWQQRQLAKAETKFKEAIALDPGAENAYQGLGWAQLNQGKKLNAKNSFEKCVALNPQNAAALNGLGWIAHGRGNTDKAIEWWEKAVDVSNGHATASLNGLTQVYMQKKEYDNAIKYYQMWLNAEPNNEQVKTKLRKAQALAD